MGLPSALSGFSSTLSFFQSAAMSGNVASALDSLAARLNTAAKRINDRAMERNLEDIDDTPISVTFGGDASAYGEDTRATSIMLGKAVDVGLVTYAIGTCTFTAAATATGDDTAVAFANSFATVEGADLVVTFTFSGSTPMTQGADKAYATSTTSFIAIDLEFWDSACGPIVIDYDWTLCRMNIPQSLEGNTAVLDALVDVFGEDTYAGIESDALSIEDTLSSVSAVGTLALG